MCSVPVNPQMSCAEKQSPNLQQIEAQVSRLLNLLQNRPEIGTIPAVAQQIQKLPLEGQQIAWRQALTMISKSSNEFHKRTLEENTRLKQPPHKVAIFEELTYDESGRPIATVLSNDGIIESTVSTEVDCSKLVPGQRLVLSQNGTVIKGRDVAPANPTCEFERIIEDGRILGRANSDQPIVLTIGGDFSDNDLLAKLQQGDLIEYVPQTQRALRIAYRSVKIREFVGEVPDVTRDNIGGLNQIWEDIEQKVLGPICNPNLYKRYQVEVPRGILFTGPPGVGKTMLIKAIANAALTALHLDKAPILFQVAGTMLLRSYVGEGQALIRSIANTAQEAAKQHGFAVVLLDDFEYGAGLHRGIGDASSPAYSALTSALISTMDGLSNRNSRVTWMATTNRPDLLDSALLRAGRFGTNIEVPRPGIEACKQIVAVHLSGVPLNNVTIDFASEQIVQRIFNADDDNVLLRVHFADSEYEDILPFRIINGALLADTVRNAAITAIIRDLHEKRDEPTGVCLNDLIESLDRRLQTAVAAITPRNVHSHYLQLPEDKRVVSIDHLHKTIIGSKQIFAA